ncbi:MAG: DUF4124 domain-containing protein [Desulfobacterales bacterium]
MRYTTLLIVVFIVAAAVPADELYTWTDSKGVTHITRTPPPPNARQKEVIEYTPQTRSEIEAIRQEREALQGRYDKEAILRNARNARREAEVARQRAAEVRSAAAAAEKRAAEFKKKSAIQSGDSKSTAGPLCDWRPRPRQLATRHLKQLKTPTWPKKGPLKPKRKPVRC